MKSWKKRPLIVTALILMVSASFLLLSVAAIAQDGNSDSGVSGLQGPQFTLGLVILASGGGATPSSAAAGKVWNGAPYALNGFVLNMYNGSIHVNIVECSQVVKDLGFNPGDTVVIYCSAEQVKGMNTGDFVEVFGFTVRGQFTRGGDNVLPPPFSY
jgi:hypothetical protein